VILDAGSAGIYAVDSFINVPLIFGDVPTNATEYRVYTTEMETQTPSLRLTVTHDGKAAINVATPNSRLHVGGSLALPIRLSTLAVTAIGQDDYTVLVDATAGGSASLPDADGIDGRIYVVKKSDATETPVTVTALGGCLIDGELAFTLDSQYRTVTVQALSGAWWVL
jgi:hypothetical protein